VFTVSAVRHQDVGIFLVVYATCQRRHRLHVVECCAKCL